MQPILSQQTKYAGGLIVTVSKVGSFVYVFASHDGCEVSARFRRGAVRLGTMKSIAVRKLKIMEASS
jgi:hypothetical protein